MAFSWPYQCLTWSLPPCYFGLINLWVKFLIFAKFHLQRFLVTGWNCLLCIVYVPIRRVCHPLLAWSPVKICFMLNFLLAHWAFPPKLPPRPPTLPCLQSSVKDSWIIQQHKVAVSTLGSALSKEEPHSARGSTTFSLVSLGHIKLLDHFFLHKKTSNFC